MYPKIFFVFLVFFIGCGGAAKRTTDLEGTDYDQLTGEDMIPQGIVSKADFTTAVDEKRYRAAAPITNDFRPTQGIIYLVGKLKRVPSHANIQVKWFLRNDSIPQATSTVRGSATYQFIASFSPQKQEFVSGAYIAKIYVDGKEIGARTFTIRGENEYIPTNDSQRVSNVVISAGVNAEMQANRQARRFNHKTKKIFVSFDVAGADSSVKGQIRWHRDDVVFHRQNLSLGTNRRYSAHIASSEGLPAGNYRVEVFMGRRFMTERKFTIVDDSEHAGSTIDNLALGQELNSNNMPIDPTSTFTRGIQVILCGFRFLELPPETILLVNWIKVDKAENEGAEDTETVLYTNQTHLPQGGSGTLGANWQPYDLSAGSYKVAIVIGDEVLAQAPFDIVDPAE
jgi:hypothetical protein